MFTQLFEELSIKTNGNKLIKITEKILNFTDRSKDFKWNFKYFNLTYKRFINCSRKCR